MKIMSPTMLGASHQVVSGWVDVAALVLFLTSSVGLQAWPAGTYRRFSTFPQHTETQEGKAATPVGAPSMPLLNQGCILLTWYIGQGSPGDVDGVEGDEGCLKQP